MSTPRTKITDLLDTYGISYRILLHTQPVFTVEAAAEQRGVVKEEMVKSILLCDKNGRYVMACVTGDARLNPKAVRTYLPDGWKRLHFASAEEILAVTDCTKGAVAPLGLPEDVPVIFDEDIARCEKVTISSGDPMAGLELNAENLIRVAGAKIGSIAEER